MVSRVPFKAEWKAGYVMVFFGRLMSPLFLFGRFDCIAAIPGLMSAIVVLLSSAAVCLLTFVFCRCFEAVRDESRFCAWHKEPSREAWTRVDPNKLLMRDSREFLCERA